MIEKYLAKLFMPTYILYGTNRDARDAQINQ